MKLEIAIEEIRKILLELSPSGPNSFEDLVARALEGVTGFGFRMMPNGRQDGADAVGQVGDILVAVEAKRYDKAKGLRQSLLLKIQEAVGARRGRPDLWIAAITAPLAGDDKQEIEAAAERADLPAIVCDWAGILPELVVLIVAGKKTTLSFLNKRSTHGTRPVSALFDAVENHPDFQKRRDLLLEEISNQALPFETFFKDSRSTNEAAMQDKHIARRLYGQFLTPLQVLDGVPVDAVIERTDLLDDLDRKVDRHSERSVPVVVVGEEGVGKSWVVADWWGRRHRETDAFVFISAASVSNRSRQLDTILSQGMLDLISRQRQTSTEASERWKRRMSLNGFKRQARGRLTVVIDGLNEEPWIDWGARVLPALIQACSDYGATLIITCRPVFWQRQVVPYLEQSLRSIIPVVRVDGFSSHERDEFLRLRGLSKEALSPRLLSEAANPRALSLAVDLVKLSGYDVVTSSGDHVGLGLDVLLLNYWDHRRTERSEFIRPDHRDFVAALRRTAKPIWEKLRQKSSRQETPSSSPLHRVIMKEWVSSLANDPADTARLVGELTEGMFFQEPAGRFDEWVNLTEKTHAFCVGLYLYGFLREKAEELMTVPQLRDWLDNEIDPVRDFDRTCEHLLAALTVACFDEDPNDVPTTILADALLRLRNRPADLYPEFAYLLDKRGSAFCSARQWLLEVSPAENRNDWISMALQQVLRRGPEKSVEVRHSISNWILGRSDRTGWLNARPVFLLDSRPLGPTDLTRLAIFIIGHTDIALFAQSMRVYAASLFASHRPLDESVRDRLLLNLGGEAFENFLVSNIEGGTQRSESEIGGDNILLAALGTPTAMQAITQTIPCWVINMGIHYVMQPILSSRTDADIEIDAYEEIRFREAIFKWALVGEAEKFKTRVLSALANSTGSVFATRLVLVAELAPTLLSALENPKLLRRALDIAAKGMLPRHEKQYERFAILMACALHACFIASREDGHAFALRLHSDSLTQSYAELVEGVGSAVSWEVPLDGDSLRYLLERNTSLSGGVQVQTVQDTTISVASRLLEHHRITLTKGLVDFLAKTVECPETPRHLLESVLRFAVECESSELAGKIVSIEALPTRYQDGIAFTQLSQLNVFAELTRRSVSDVLHMVDPINLPLLVGLVAEQDVETVVEALVTAVNAILSGVGEDCDERETVEISQASDVAARRIWQIAGDRAENWYKSSRSDRQSKAIEKFLSSLLPALDRPRRGCDLHLKRVWKNTQERGSTFPKIGLAARYAMFALDVDEHNVVARFDAILIGLVHNDSAYEGLVDLILESGLRRKHAKTWIDAAAQSRDAYRISNAIRLAASLDLQPPQFDVNCAVIDLASDTIRKIKRRTELMRHWYDYPKVDDKIKRAMMEVEIFSCGVVRIPDDAPLRAADRALFKAVARKSRNDADLENSRRFFGYREPPLEWLFPDMWDLMPGERLAHVGTPAESA